MMKMQIALWIALLFTSCATSDTLFDKATELENQGAYAEAIEVLNRLIKSDPSYLPAYISRGADETELKKWSEAIDDYSYVINCDSTYIVAWVNRGNSKIQLGDYPGALTDLKTAAQIKRQVYGDMQLVLYNTPTDLKNVSLEELCLSRGIAYWYADSLNQAYHDFNYCIEQQYEIVESLYWRAYTYWKAGKEAEAYLDFVSVIRFGEEDDRRVTEAKNNLENLNIDKKKK